MLALVLATALAARAEAPGDGSPSPPDADVPAAEAAALPGDVPVRVVLAGQDERGGARGAGAPDASSSRDAPSFDPSEALLLQPIGTRELAWLEPRRARLPQHPYQHVDFTAYTLEWGEVRLGLARIDMGVLPRVQVGTSPVLDALGIYNGSGKADLLRLGPLDLAGEASHHRLPLGDFTGFQTSFGGTVSMRVTEPWSFHVHGAYSVLGADGLPDLSRVSPLLRGAIDVDLWSYDLSELAPGRDVHVRARTVTARVATDVRVNRRDSVILQAQARLWGGVIGQVDEEVPPVFGLDRVLEQDGDGRISIRDAYVASVAWNLAWKRAELRLGIGASSVPGAWLFQATELCWRFGGPTRLQERRMRRGWKRNLELVEHGDGGRGRSG